MFIKHSAISAALLLFSNSQVFAQAVRIEESLDLESEKIAQMEKVANGRRIFSGHNYDESLIGSVILCDETSPGSRIFEPKGAPYPLNVQVAVEMLDFEESTSVSRIEKQLIVVTKGGSLLGGGGASGAELGKNNRRLVEISTYEAARFSAPQSLDDQILNEANGILKRAGMPYGTSACYISSSTKIVQKTFVDEERKMNLSTPAIFIVVAKASFQRNQSNLSRGSVMTADAQAFLSAEPVFGAHNGTLIQAVDRTLKRDVAVIDFSQYVLPETRELDKAKQLAESVRRYIDFIEHASASDIILSQSALEKLEKMFPNE